MSDLKPGDPPNTGELLDGRYQLHESVGAGGMGVVYRARDETLGRTVAVKVFRASAADAARSTSETRLLAALNHASLVTLFDAQTAPGRPNYLVMEYVDGPTLRERLTEGTLDRRDVATMARDLADALHVVHQAGIVHRDIKPSNVLLRRSHVPGEHYRAKLADFGIAYLLDSTRLTTPGTLVGTVAYLSPEQVRGATPAPAGDIYSLGLVLLEALTGERAFPQTATHESALARLTRDPLIPGELGYAWKSLLTAMTARDPEQRPGALEVAMATAGLTTDDAGPATGAALPAATGELTVTAGIPEPTATAVLPEESATAVLPEESATAVLVDVPARASVDEPSDPADPAAPIDEAPRRASRRRLLLVALGALLLVAVIVVALVWMLGASDPAAAPAPTLPPLDDPLGAHLQQLLDAVSR